MPKSFAKTQQFSVPMTSLSVGVHGPFSSGNLPTQLQGYIVDLQNDATWPVGDPANPQPVVRLDVEVSTDAGQTWVSDASITLADQPWQNRDKTPTNISEWNVSLPTDDLTGRRARLTVTVSIACRLGATFSSY